MAVASTQVTVSTSAVALTPATETDTVAGTKVYVRNDNATASNGVAIGATGVTTGTGYVVPGGSQVGPIELNSGEQLFGIRTGAADAVVHVLRTGV